MKRFYFIFVIFILASKLAAQENVSIEQCYQWAKANYPLIKQYRLIEQSEQFNLSNAGKGYLPQFSLNAKATYQSDVTKLPLDIPISGLVIPTLNKDQYQVVAEVNQTVWDGGVIRSNKDVLKAKARTEIGQVETDLYTLNQRINDLFFGILLQNELLRQNVILQNDFRVNIDRIKAMITNGVANQSDLESMTVELLNAHQKEIELQAARKGYIQVLSALTGQPIGETSTLVIPVVQNDLSLEIHRPELDLFNQQSQLVKMQDKQISAGIMPRIGLFMQGGYGRPGLNMLSDDFDAFYIGGIRLSWNLGKLYTLKNDRRKLETDCKTIDVQRETFLFNTRMQLTQQHTEIEKINKLIQTDAKIVALRTSIKKSAEVKLINGVISVTDLIHEINAEDLSRQTEASHRIQRLMAIYNYKYTTNN